MNEQTTEKAKHTPGPWTVETWNDGQARIWANGQMIAKVIPYNDDKKPLTENEQANARLIAAAPQLLEAAWLALEKLETAGEYPRLREELRAAIASATGESEGHKWWLGKRSKNMLLKEAATRESQ